MSPDVVNCREGKSSFLFIDSLGVVNFLQQGPGLLKFVGSVHVGGRAQVKRLAGWSMGANLTASPFGTFEFAGKGRLYTWCMYGVQQVWRIWWCGLLSEWCGWCDGWAAGAALGARWWGRWSVNVHCWLL